MFKLASTVGVLAVGAGLLEGCMFDVDAGNRAVVLNLYSGVEPEVRGKGTHFKVPILQTPFIIDVRSSPRVIHSATGTKDLQMVNISLRVLSRPLESALVTIYNEIGLDFNNRILPSLGNEVLKSVVAQYNAEELLSKRELVSEQIRRAIIKRAETFNLIIDDVSITHLTYGKEFSKAVENKQVAQQEAETQQYVVMKADQERKASIIRAEGEAEAANLISKAMHSSGNGLVEVRRIDAAKTVAELLANSTGVTYLPGSGSNTGGSGGSNILLNVGGK